MAIRAALGLSTRTYAAWAKLFGFRQCDLRPDAVRPGAPPRHPPGPGAYARSGRHLRDLPPGPEDGRHVSGPEHPAWAGGVAASRARYQGLRAARKADLVTEVAAMRGAAEVLAAVRAALEAGDQARADGLLAAWKAQTRRARDLAALEAAAEAERGAGAGPDPAQMSNQELADNLERLTGRRFTITD